MPEYTSAKFSPRSLNLLGNKSIKTRMTIEMEDNVELRDHLIDIIATGEDGKEKRCSMTLSLEPETYGG
jgi:hypothetical protein